jgi:hypothetical protein
MVVSKSTENEVTSYLVQILSKKIPKLYPFRRILTPNGEREVDFIAENGGTYLLEAKYTEDELLNAIAKVQNDYLKHYKILGIKGGFALLYPEELKKPMPPEKLKALLPKVKFLLICQFTPEDKRGFTQKRGNLEEIGNYLSELILEPSKSVEIDVEFLIETLKLSVGYIVESLKELTDYELKKIFGEEKIFKYILPTEEYEIPIQNLREGAAYILLTQLLFYHILSRIGKDLPEIDPDKVNNPQDLDVFFDKLIEKTKDYKAIFSYRVSKVLPSNQDTVRKIKDLINVIRGLAPEKIGGDLLGTVFHDLVPFEVRKTVAAYYTNVLAAELLAWLSIDSYRDKVIDLAVGSGGLLVASYRRKKYLAGEKFDEKLHREFIEEDLYGIDIMPFAAAIAACHLALQSPQFFTQRVNIGIWDSTELTPEIKIPTITTTIKRFLSRTISQKQLYDFTKISGKEKTVEKRVVELGETFEDIKLSKVNVVIMNPPFTRQERLPKEYKEKLEARFKDYKAYLHGQMSYFGYFVFLADKFLENEGRMALVLPATSLSKKHTEGIRKFLADNYLVEYIILNQERLSFSESTLFREILLIARKTKQQNGKTKIIFLKKFPETLEESREIAEIIKNTQQEYEDDGLLVKPIDYQILKRNTNNWYKWIIYSPVLEFMNQIFNSKKLKVFPFIKDTVRFDLDKVKIGNFHAFISFSEERALKKYDLWIVEKIEKNKIIVRHRILGKKIEVPLSILKRGLRRHTNVKRMDVSEIADFIISNWNDVIKEIAKYLLTYQELKKINRELIPNKWGKYIKSRECNLLVLRRPFIASPGTRCLAFFSEEKIVGVNMWHVKIYDEMKEYSKILCLWFNSSLSILQLLAAGIASEGNWTKIDEYMLTQLYIPDLKNLKDEEKELLLHLFEKLKSKEWDPILEQFEKKNKDRYEIDKTYLKILGFEEEKIKEVLDKIYTIILGELKSLASTGDAESVE